MSPALLLVLLLILIGAQVARLVSPRRLPYAWLLVLSAAGVVGAELLVLTLHAGGPALGVLHPVADVIGIAICEGAALGVTSTRQRAR